MQDSLLGDSTFLTIGDYQASFWEKGNQQKGSQWTIIVPPLLFAETGSYEKELKLYVMGSLVDSLNQKIKINVPRPASFSNIDNAITTFKAAYTNIKINTYRKKKMVATDMLFLAQLSVFDTLFADSGKYSFIKAMNDLKTLDTKAYAAVQNLLNIHGVLERINEMKALSIALRNTKPLLKRSSNPTPLFKKAEKIETTYLSTKELAKEMQAYVLWEAYALSLHEAINDFFFDFVALGAISKIAAPIAVIQATLAWTDFFINKVYLATFPSAIDNLRILPAQKIYDPGDTTLTRFQITAKNNAQNVGFQDIISLILATLGVPASHPSFQVFKNSLEEFGHSAALFVQGFIALQNDNHPEWKLDVTLIKMPDWRWNANINDTAYVDRVSLDTATLKPSLSENEWIFNPDLKEAKEVEVYFKTATRKEELIFVSPPPFITYNGGIFGEDAALSPKETFFLTGSELRVDLDYPLSYMEAGDIATLTIHATYKDNKDSITDVKNAKVTLSVTGGTIDSTQGITNEEGKFSFQAQMGKDEKKMLVTITLKDSVKNEVTKKATFYKSPEKTTPPLFPPPKEPVIPAVPMAQWCPKLYGLNYARYNGDPTVPGENLGYSCLESCEDTDYKRFKIGRPSYTICEAQ